MNTEKAFDILKKIQNAGNIHIPEKAELKSELITELEEIIPLGKQKEIKELQNTSILFLGNVKEAILAGCYSHCLRDIKFYFEVASQYRRRDPGGANAELTKGEIDSEYKNSMNGKLIYKDCYGQYLETIWLKDDNNCFRDDLYYLRNTGIREWLTFNEHGITVFLTRLEGKDTCECKQFVKELESRSDGLLMNYSQCLRSVKGLESPESTESRSFLRHRLLIHANDKNDLPKYFTDLFRVINLEPEKEVRQDTPVSTPKDTPEKQAQSTKQNNKPIYYKKTGVLSYDGKDTTLRGQRKKIFEAMVLKKVSKKQEIFNYAFKPNKEYGINTPLKASDKNRFDSELSELKSQCFDDIGIVNMINKEEREGDYYSLTVVIRIK